MKFIAMILISVATFFTLDAFIPTSNDAKIYDACVRLHVLANSDDESDQELKLKVRDKLLLEVGKYEAKDRDEALTLIENDKERLNALAKEVILENGYDYPVRIEIGLESYPTRVYEDFSLPAGEYTSVRVIIGEGKGQNWWCVLYPPLCTSSALKYDDSSCVDVGLTKEQYGLITGTSGGYKVKFKLLEIASEMVSKNE